MRFEQLDVDQFTRFDRKLAKHGLTKRENEMLHLNKIHNLYLVGLISVY